MVDPVSSAPGTAVSVVPAETPALGALLTLSVGVVVVAALYLAREVLIPITLAILLSFVLVPLVDLLRRIHLPDVVAVLAAVILSLGIILSVGGLIGMQVASLATEVPAYASTIEKKVETVRGATLGRLADLMSRLNRQIAHSQPPQPTASAPQAGADTSRASGLGNGPQPVPVEVQQPAAQPIEIARSILTPVLAPISETLIVVLIAIFILMQREDLRDRLIRLFGSSDLHRTTLALDEAARRLSSYFLAQLGINAIFGVAVTIGLALIGVPSPALWGVLAAFLRFVPYVGAPIAAVLPVAVAAAVSPGWSMVGWTVALFVAAESITGQVVEPLIYGHSTGLSPVAVVVAAIFWTWIWGPIGLVLSTPLTLCLMVLGRHVDRLEFLDVLLGDRPALTPIENFYQRLLAQDPDETLQQAELLLKDRSLSAYYDEIAVKGLQLAAGDALRGVLPVDRIDRITKSAHDLIADLADHPDGHPRPHDKTAAADESKVERAVPAPAPPDEGVWENASWAPGWDGAAPVLCLAGRGPFDEAASAMLAQLLGKHGLAARAAPHSMASREGIGNLDPAGIAMVCVTYLELSGTPSNLHYTLRRLRQRLPRVPVLVGLWPSEEEVLHDRRLRDVIGADYYTTSLKEAVETCVAVAHEAACLVTRRDNADKPIEPPEDLPPDAMKPVPVSSDGA